MGIDINLRINDPNLEEWISSKKNKSKLVRDSLKLKKTEELDTIAKEKNPQIKVSDA